MSNRRLANKTAIVTGALGGIGAAIAQSLAAEGAKLMLADIRQSDVDRADLLERGAPRVEAMMCDVSQEQAIVRLVDATIDAFGKLDIIMNVAGAMIYKPIGDLTATDWTRTLGVNFLGASFLTTQGFRCMKPGSVIVNVASVHAERTSATVAPYAAAKAALVSLTRSAAIEGRALGIHANAILPGAVDTEMLRSSPNVAAGIEVFEPGEVGAPGNVADVAVFLASDASQFMTGASVVVDGGLLARL